MYDIVGIESPCVDLNVNVNQLPGHNTGSRVNNLSWQGGNKVSSGMVAAARLGARCAMMGTVGDDLFGRFCLEDFARHGINTDHMLVREGTVTSMSVVLSDLETGGRSIMFRPGPGEPIRYDELDHEAVKTAKYLYIVRPHTRNETVDQAVALARRSGVKVFIDADSYTDEGHRLLPQIDIFIGSEFYYDRLFQDRDYERNCAALMQQGPETVIFTLGARGCVGMSREEGFFSLDTYVVPVVDTVGAGDVFHGAYLAGLLAGRGARDAADLACAVSSIKCTRIGGRAGIPDMKTVLRFMEEGTIDYTEIDRRVAFYERGLDQVR